jgi:hypothetical protein
MRRVLLTGLVGFALSGPVHAADPSDRVSSAFESFAHGLVLEQDVELVFGYLREALSAAIAGRELPAADVLVQRAEAIGEEARRRAETLGRALLDAIELGVRESIKQPSRSEVARPLQRSGY